jgi:hypothetical protein
MLATSIFYAAIGIILGTRFKILVLGPAFILALLTTASFGVAARLGAWEIADALLISLVALQASYLADSLVGSLFPRAA